MDSSLDDLIKKCTEVYNYNIIYKRINIYDLELFMTSFKKSILGVKRAAYGRYYDINPYNDMRDLVLSGQGEGNLQYLNVMLIEFFDWIKINAFEGTTGCKNIIRLLDNRLVKDILSDELTKELEDIILNTYELKNLCNLYIKFKKELEEMQLIILQKYIYNNNSLPRVIVPFSSELNFLSSVTLAREDRHRPSVYRHGVYISNYNNIEKIEDIVSPFIVANNSDDFINKSFGISYSNVYKKLPNFVFKKVVPYVHDIYPIYSEELFKGEGNTNKLDKILTFELPLLWNYLIKDIRKSLPTIVAQSAARVLIIKYIYEQYSYIGFGTLSLPNEVLKSMMIEDDTFFINNPFLNKNKKDIITVVPLKESIEDDDIMSFFIPKDGENELTKIRVDY